MFVSHIFLPASALTILDCRAMAGSCYDHSCCWCMSNGLQRCGTGPCNCTVLFLIRTQPQRMCWWQPCCLALESGVRRTYVCACAGCSTIVEPSGCACEAGSGHSFDRSTSPHPLWWQPPHAVLSTVLTGSAALAGPSSPVAALGLTSQSGDCSVHLFG